MRKFLSIVRIIIEELWRVLFLLWVLPPAIIELIWLLCIDRKKLRDTYQQFKRSEYFSLEIWK